MAEVRWLEAYDDTAAAGVYRVVRDVVALGGAVGWPDGPPGREECEGWLRHSLSQPRDRFATVVHEGRVEALGILSRYPETGVFRHNGQLRKIMVHPDQRGTGLGRLLVEALVERARQDGVELLTLDARGNNHGAHELYRRCGFTEVGRLPNAVAVGEERWDSVTMAIELQRPPGVDLIGGERRGAGRT